MHPAVCEATYFLKDHCKKANKINESGFQLSVVKPSPELESNIQSKWRQAWKNACEQFGFTSDLL